jgi:hypothetical protein
MRLLEGRIFNDAESQAQSHIVKRSLDWFNPDDLATYYGPPTDAEADDEGTSSDQKNQFEWFRTGSHRSISSKNQEIKMRLNNTQWRDWNWPEYFLLAAEHGNFFNSSWGYYTELRHFHPELKRITMFVFISYNISLLEGKWKTNAVGMRPFLGGFRHPSSATFPDLASNGPVVTAEHNGTERALK